MVEEIVEKTNLTESNEENEHEKVLVKSDEHGPKKSIFKMLENDIMESDIPDAEKAKRLTYLAKLSGEKVNIMFVGATGSGKSSTINALFNMEVAKVGVTANPETNEIAKYDLGNLIIWDTPGLGDSEKGDKRIIGEIIRKLNEKDDEGNMLIDMVMVILDASSKDLGTSYELINNVLIPCLGDEAERRILIGLNQSDVAMKGKHWDAGKNEPDEVLKAFIDKKAVSVMRRIEETTGLCFNPVCYCAGYKEEGEEQCNPYNLTKLLFHIVSHIVPEKRLAIIENLNNEEETWSHDDEEDDYCGKVTYSFGETVWDAFGDGLEEGCRIGEKILGVPGKVIGGVIGSAVGTIGGVLKSIFRI